MQIACDSLCSVIRRTKLLYGIKWIRIGKVKPFGISPGGMKKIEINSRQHRLKTVRRILLILQASPK